MIVSLLVIFYGEYCVIQYPELVYCLLKFANRIRNTTVSKLSKYELRVWEGIYYLYVIKRLSQDREESICLENTFYTNLRQGNVLIEILVNNHNFLLLCAAHPTPNPPVQLLQYNVL